MSCFSDTRAALKRSALSFVLLGLMFAFTPASATSMEEAAKSLEGMTWYTEEYPPYNFADKDGTPTGMTVDILLAAFDKLNVTTAAADFKIVSWNRSYKYIQKKPGTALFSMTMTPERQKIMKFVGPALPLAISVIAPKDSSVVIRTSDDLNNYKIGVVSKDIGDQLIAELALNNASVRRINSAGQLYALLETGKVDVVVYSEDVFKNVVKKAGGDPSKYQGLHVLKEGQVGYAFHQSTDAGVLGHLQRAIDELKTDGTIDKIIAGYNN